MVAPGGTHSGQFWRAGFKRAAFGCAAFPLGPSSLAHDPLLQNLLLQRGRNREALQAYGARIQLSTQDEPYPGTRERVLLVMRGVRECLTATFAVVQDVAAAAPLPLEALFPPFAVDVQWRLLLQQQYLQQQQQYLQQQHQQQKRYLLQRQQMQQQAPHQLQPQQVPMLGGCWAA
ncbi:hypothetical protein TSOC_010989 [Tetrabaena socialis]|uniref:Uncharacterized protein n=1 Tax=Tetrabaena socialis TaxID=47790 RepID=A0A2J7ZRU1_9CHLO|nr:hypothetical protein TSOC_010989 [Tetrabaena socialis]|eukprot:PNH02989.1 hypothetical protein TSOC_010989 [Tetrabaena socialis]